MNCSNKWKALLNSIAKIFLNAHPAGLATIKSTSLALFLSPGPFHTSGIAGLQHTINMDGRDEFTEDSECCSNNSQEVQEQDSISGTGRRETGQGGTGRTLWDILGLRGVRESKPRSVFCCLSVCIDRAVFASIEDSDSDPDNHGEDSSSNTSADDHMTTKRSQCCLQGAGVKEVREFVPA